MSECSCDLWHCTMEDHAAGVEVNRRLWRVATAAREYRALRREEHEVARELEEALADLDRAVIVIKEPA